MFRYPLGGMLSWPLQYLTALKQLGHDVYVVEKYVYPDSCYDPVKHVVSDDCSYGIKVVSALLAQYGLENKWCFVENGNVYYGLSERQVNEVFRRADLYVENGAHGAWEEESTLAAKRIFIDVDPAFTQIKFYHKLNNGGALPEYDFYYTIGMNVGTPGNIIPTNNIDWKYIFNPVNTSLFEISAPPSKAPYSTIMNWKSYDDPVEYNGIKYGHKNIEFEKFKLLPKLLNVSMEMAVSGLKEPDVTTVKDNGWIIKNAHEVTLSLNSFQKYLYNCKGEFSVCKNMYVATSSGWFSDKSAAFMACGRPVIVQETGFSKYLPVGEGLFAVNNAEEAKNAIEVVEGNYALHSKRAYEIAFEFLEAKKVLKKVLDEISL